MKLHGSVVTSVVASALLGVVAMAPSIMAQQAPPPPATEVGASQLAMLGLPAKGGEKLKVTSPAFKNDGDIPFENTQYRGNVFPGLSWTSGPSGTKSYAIIMQDADAMRNGAPILHWTMFDIPGSVTSLEPAMSAPPAGAQYGPNIRGPNQAYMGPHTPVGPKHRYHIQLFALDTTIPAESVTTYASLLDAMKGHVLASGQLVGLGQAMPSTTP